MLAFPLGPLEVQENSRKVHTKNRPGVLILLPERSPDSLRWILVRQVSSTNGCGVVSV